MEGGGCTRAKQGKKREEEGEEGKSSLVRLPKESQLPRQTQALHTTLN